MLAKTRPPVHSHTRLQGPRAPVSFPRIQKEAVPFHEPFNLIAGTTLTRPDCAVLSLLAGVLRYRGLFQALDADLGS